MGADGGYVFINLDRLRKAGFSQDDINLFKDNVCHASCIDVDDENDLARQYESELTCDYIRLPYGTNIHCGCVMLDHDPTDDSQVNNQDYLWYYREYCKEREYYYEYDWWCEAKSWYKFGHLNETGSSGYWKKCIYSIPSPEEIDRLQYLTDKIVEVGAMSYVETWT